MCNTMQCLTVEELFSLIKKNTNVSLDSITLDNETIELFNGNVYKFGLLLYDVYELTGHVITKDEQTFFHRFPTVQSLVDVFCTQAIQ